ncbi:MAG TPA: hypothetical protein VFJ05_01480 [Nitrososphaeraceae archaeon]|nr:hypothetical protein [Nitrososphaeraceae archaeon]
MSLQIEHKQHQEKQEKDSSRIDWRRSPEAKQPRTYPEGDSTDITDI